MTFTKLMMFIWQLKLLNLVKKNLIKFVEHIKIQLSNSWDNYFTDNCQIILSKVPKKKLYKRVTWFTK